MVAICTFPRVTVVGPYIVAARPPPIGRSQQKGKDSSASCGLVNEWRETKQVWGGERTVWSTVPRMMYVVREQPCLIASAAGSRMEPLHTPGVVALFIEVVVATTARHQVRTLMVNVSCKRAVDRTRCGVMKRFLQAVAMHSGIARDPQQPLIRVRVVHDIAGFCAHIWANA